MKLTGTISHYRIPEKLGEGGMGEVYLAQDTLLGRKVALKFLSEALQEDPTASGRFLREAKVAAAIEHPYVCQVFEIGESDGRSFIATEYVVGAGDGNPTTPPGRATTAHPPPRLPSPGSRSILAAQSALLI